MEVGFTKYKNFYLKKKKIYREFKNLVFPPQKFRKQIPRSYDFEGFSDLLKQIVYEHSTDIHEGILINA